MRNIFYILLISLLNIACEKEHMGDCFKSAGAVNSELRNVDAFINIELLNNVDLVLTTDSIQTVKVETGKNLLAGIKTEVVNGKLIISNANKCNWVRSYKTPITAYVSLPTLRDLTYRGSGNITSTNTIISDSLNINCWDAAGTITLTLNTQTSVCAIHTGPADLVLSGTSGVNYVWNSGNGFVYADALQTGYTYLLHKGTGECHVRATIELGATLQYIGNVYYTGNPANVQSHITGTGQLIKAD